MESLWAKLNPLLKDCELYNKLFPETKRVYVMELDDNTVKIGVSEDPQLRSKHIEQQNKVTVLRTYCTEYIPVDKAFAIENACHKAFKKFIAHHNEYFKISFDDACTELNKYAEEIRKINVELEKMREENAEFLKRFKEQHDINLDKFWECFFQPTEQKTVIHGNKTIAPQFVSPREKLNRLDEYIKLCTDENLRDDLIRMATNILLDKID